MYDLLGRAVATGFEGWLEAGGHLLRFDASHLPPGVCVFTLPAGGVFIYCVRSACERISQDTCTVIGHHACSGKSLAKVSFSGFGVM